MKAYSLSKSDTYSLVSLAATGSRTVHESVVREIESGRSVLVSLGLATLDGNVLTITEKGREWTKPYPDALPF